ncbi:hypothetical protein ASC90_22100 [Rhizobium sp. Root1220]|nr:hypothetical protein ASC90_22100 [Rhizobium sp. Root1220]
MVEFFRPTGRILEPSKGEGVFLKYIPDCLWCEIDEGRDFFAWSEHVDWIIGNPPYSKTREFMRHAFRYAQNVVFLVPARNIFSGYGTVTEGHQFGAMKNMRWYGTGSKLGFPMGNGIAAIHWQKGYVGQTNQTFYQLEKPGELAMISLTRHKPCLAVEPTEGGEA